MDQRAWHDRIESTADDPTELFEHFQSRTAADIDYHVLPESHHGVERGTVIIEAADAIIRGYPSVPRVLLLDPGIESYFQTGPITVEEKLNGFNVRIVDIGEIVAFTRGGHICPYTTARAREALDAETFFADYPEMMLCAELIGPETPYTDHDYDGIDTNAFRVFDIRDRESGRPLPTVERRERCETYGFVQPRLFGHIDIDEAVATVTDAIETLDTHDREGVVMKSADGTSLLKYTAEGQHHRELAGAFALPFEYGQDFFFSRVLREAFQTVEFEESTDRRRERAHDLGESILVPMAEAIEAVRDGETLGEHHTVRGSPDTIDALLAHLREFHLTIEIEADTMVENERVVTFTKIAESSTDQIAHFLDGGLVSE